MKQLIFVMILITGLQRANGQTYNPYGIDTISYEVWCDSSSERLDTMPVVMLVYNKGVTEVDLMACAIVLEGYAVSKMKRCFMLDRRVRYVKRHDGYYDGKVITRPYLISERSLGPSLFLDKALCPLAEPFEVFDYHERPTNTKGND